MICKISFTVAILSFCVMFVCANLTDNLTLRMEWTDWLGLSALFLCAVSVVVSIIAGIWGF